MLKVKIKQNICNFTNKHKQYLFCNWDSFQNKIVIIFETLIFHGKGIIKNEKIDQIQIDNSIEKFLRQFINVALNKVGRTSEICSGGNFLLNFDQILDSGFVQNVILISIKRLELDQVCKIDLGVGIRAMQTEESKWKNFGNEVM